MNFIFRNAQNEKVYEGVVSKAFLHVLADFELASARHNGGWPLPIYFDSLDAFYELTSAAPQPIDFGAAKATLLGDPQTDEVSIVIFAPFGEEQEVLIAHEIGHMYLLALGYPAVFAPEGITKLATGIANIASHWPLNYYLRSCEIDVDTDNERRVSNVGTYLDHIDLVSEDPIRMSLDFADILAYVSNSTRHRFEELVRRNAPHVYEVMTEVRLVLESVPCESRLYPSGSEELMRKLCSLFPAASSYDIRKDFFSSLLPNRRS